MDGPSRLSFWSFSQKEAFRVVLRGPVDDVLRFEVPRTVSHGPILLRIFFVFSTPRNCPSENENTFSNDVNPFRKVVYVKKKKKKKKNLLATNF